MQTPIDGTPAPAVRRLIGTDHERHGNLDQQLDVFPLAALLGNLGTTRMLASWAKSRHSQLRRRHFAMELEPGPLTVEQLSRSLDIPSRPCPRHWGKLARLSYIEQSDDADRRRRPTNLNASGREVLRDGLEARAALAKSSAKP